MRKQIERIVPVALGLILASGGNATANGYHNYGYKYDNNVKCYYGESIQSALDRADNGDTIKVRGTCTENIIIRKNGIKLEADGDASITAADATTRSWSSDATRR